ncbi:MAG: hypothetical protein R3B99_27025 [Polyangiales bacterium]
MSVALTTKKISRELPSSSGSGGIRALHAPMLGIITSCSKVVTSGLSGSSGALVV